ncbi:MAG: PQQ-dependent sugar dehydrogenase [Pseudomonadota bacterium]
MFRSLTAALFIALGTTASAQVATSSGAVTMTPVVQGLNSPWGFGFLPGGEIIMTEQDGRVLLVRPGSGVTELGGAPDVVSRGQGGLLDVLVPRDFASSRELFFTYSRRQGMGGAGTAVAKARLSADGTRLDGLETIFETAPGGSGGRHFGSRLVEARDGTLYLTIGDRGDRPSAQDLTIENGSVVRITKDGAIPSNNPFVGRSDVQPGIWSFGHRNPQGMALDADGNIWTVEHGARGGDEINFIEPGNNYGWPVISYGRHYSGARIGEGTAKEGMEQPAHYWDPSIAPSGMMIYSGALFPDWRGDIFVGSLNSDLISRLDISGRNVSEAERIQSDETARVRDIREAPDGAIWFLSAGNGTLYRVTPASS